MNATKNFKGLKPCGNNKTVHTGGGLKFADVSATPKVSPYTYTTSEFVLAIPSDAAEVYIKTSTECKVSTNSSFTGHINVIGGHPFAVADLDELHFDPSAGGVLEFYFVTV